MSMKYVEKKMCGDKLRHPSKWKAQLQIREDIKRKRYEKGDKHPYLCPFCHYWHVGG